ncbi:MAG: Ig-like domain-containing protein [Candidatus Thorarchaeota archaeon]
MMKNRTVSSFRPCVKPFSKNQRELLQIGLPLVVVMLLFTSLCSIDVSNNSSVISINEIEGQFEPASNLVGVNLPYYVPSVAAGNTTHGRGVVWIFNDTLRFRDPINIVDASVNIGLGNPLHNTLIGADVDLDGYTEFLFIMFNLTNTNLVVVDFDGGGSVTKYNYDPIPDPTGIIVGDFNGDSLIDVGVYSRIRLVIKDLNSDTILGVFPQIPFTTEEIVKVCVGNFSIAAGDEIGVMWIQDPWTSLSRVVVDTIYGDGTSINPSPILSTPHVHGYDMVSFEYDNDFDNLAVTMADNIAQENVLIALNANLTPRFSFRDTKYLGESYVKTGKFNMDMQEDLVVVPGMRSSVIFVSGVDGRVLRISQEECVSMFSRGFATDYLDSDSFTDVVLEGPTGQFSLIRGSNGEIGYEDPRLPGPFEQVLSYDINNDGRSDTIMHYGQIKILLSDTAPPEVTLDPIYPTHPTVYDPYLKVELTATDEMYVREAKVYIRPSDFAVGGYQENAMTEAQGGKFIFFQTDLQAGNYEYYIKVVDPFLNTYSYGNFSNPHILTVEGHLASGVHYNVTFDEAQRHVLALGNDSLGESRIYNVVSDMDFKSTSLRVFSSNFTKLGEFTLTDATDEVFEVYTGMFDGDNVLDPILISNNYTHIKIWAFNGDTFTSWKNTSYSLYPAKAAHGMVIVDDDGDKIDELAYVGENSTGQFLIRADDSFGTWTDAALKEWTSIVDYVPINMYGTDPQLAILRYDNAVYLYQLNNVTYLKTLNYTSPGATDYDDPVSIQVYRNSTHTSDQLLVVYRSWLVDVPTNYVCLVDRNTVNVGDWPSYIFTGQHIRVTLPHDVDEDGVDELSFLDAGGNASLYELTTTAVQSWTVFVSDAIPRSGIVLDFDGDGEDEFVISTSDDLLTAISFSGTIDYAAYPGIAFNMAPIGNVDVGAGEDIVAFPIFKSRNTLATIRNIDLLYMLDVAFDLETSVTLQGSSLWANTTVLNVFSEPVSDASVSLVASYRFGIGTSEQTMGMVYEDSTQLYTTTVAPNWPMGLANLSLYVDHLYYNPISFEFENALRVESPLSISLFTESEVLQGNNLHINITVTDILGSKVTDADVNVTLDGIIYPVSYVEGSYFRSIIGIDLSPGSYTVLASADHQYATSGTSLSKSLSVVAYDLTVLRNSPPQTQQDQSFTTWLNVTDPFGNPISSATVSVDFGVIEFTLIEIEPGRYQLNDIASMPVGNYSGEIIIQHPYVEGTVFGSYHMAVTGTLAPAVAYESTVTGGNNFTVSVFVYDSYGVTPVGAWAKIELGGSNYTATHIEGAEFRVTLNASLSVGQHSIIVYVGADFGDPRADAHDLFVYSLPETSVESSLGWILTQGDLTTLTVTVRDWYGSLIPDATVSLLSPASILFTPYGDGTYWMNLDTNGYSPANYSLLILIEHTYLFAEDSYHVLTVNGQAVVDVSMPDIVYNHQTSRFDFVVVDTYGNPIYTFDYDFVFAGTFTKSGTSYSYETSWEFQPDLYPGKYQLNITISGPFLSQSEFMIWVDIIGNPLSIVPSPLDQSTYIQGNEINFTVVVEDLAGYSISTALVTATIRGSTYTLTEGVPGVYSRQVPTAGLPLGQYNITVAISHSYLSSQLISFQLFVKGYASVDLSITPSPVLNQYNVTFDFTVTDAYGNALTGFNYTLDFAGIYNRSGFSASHKISWTIDPSFVPGSYWLNMSVESNLILRSTHNVSIGVQGIVAAQIIQPSPGASFSQGETINFVVRVRDNETSFITGATVTLYLHGTTYPLIETSIGFYEINITTTNLPLGEYSAQITVSGAFMETQQLTASFDIIGDAIVRVDTNPLVLLNYENATFTIAVEDQYGNPIGDYHYVLDFGGVYSFSGTSDYFKIIWTFIPELIPGQHLLNVTISGLHIPTSTTTFMLEVKSQPNITLLSPIENATYIQGTDSIIFKVDLFDMLDNVMDGGSVSVLIHDSFFVLVDHNNGTYSRVVSTAGWAAGIYNYTLTIDHPYLAQESTTRGTIEVHAELVFNVEFFPEVPQQGDQLNITIEVTDKYGNPVPDLTITVTFQSQTKLATELGQIGKYVVSYIVASEGYGDEPIVIAAEGIMCVTFSPQTLSEVPVIVAVPQLSLPIEQFVPVFGIVFLVSFIGLWIYFRISSGLSFTRGSQEQLLRGLRRLDYLYGVIVALAGLTIFHSYVSAGSGNYSLAVLESVLLLGISLILYGIWLYRDAASSVLHSQRIGRRRMFLGLWHLIFVPIVIVQLFDWGQNIEWLKFYVLDNVFHLGEIQVPTIMMTIFAAYISSIVIVVLNVYRDIRKGISRLGEMAVLGTPPIVVEQECADLVESLGSSIRMKFFMFLVVLAGTTVLTMDFLRSYSLGVIVLLPVVFLVVIPYTSSRMAKGLSRASSSVRSRRDDGRTLTEIADDRIEVDEIESATAEDVIISEEIDDKEPTATRPESRLTKSEIIAMLPEELKELMGIEELEKLTKAQLRELLPVEDDEE